MGPGPGGVGGAQRVRPHRRRAGPLSAVLPPAGGPAGVPSGVRLWAPRGHLPADHHLPDRRPLARRRRPVRGRAPRPVPGAGARVRPAGGDERRAGADGRPLHPPRRVRRAAGPVRRPVAARRHRRVPRAGKRRSGLYALPAGRGRRAAVALGHHLDPGRRGAVALRAGTRLRTPRRARRGRGQLRTLLRSLVPPRLPDPRPRPADRRTARSAAGPADRAVSPHRAGVAAAR